MSLPLVTAVSGAVLLGVSSMAAGQETKPPGPTHLDRLKRVRRQFLDMDENTY